MRVAVIANPTLRRLGREPHLLDQIELAARGRAPFFAPDGLDELEHALRTVVEEGTEAVVVAGGDGTLLRAVSALCRASGDAPPAVVPISVGTVGTLAKSFGLGGAPLARLVSFLRAPEAARFRAQATLRVTPIDDEPAAPLTGFIWGSGLIARFFDAYEALPRQGVGPAARLALRVFAESFRGGPTARAVLTPMPATLSIEGQAPLGPAFSLLCTATIDNLGLGLRVTYRAGEAPGRLHLVASRLGPRGLGLCAHNVLLGRTIGGSGHVDQLVERFSVRFDSAEGGGSWVLDGDRFRSREVCVEPGPEIRVLAPARG